MSKPALAKGLKRICMSCSARFYDMNNIPIICPVCGEEFTGEIKVKTRRGRAALIEEENTAPISKAGNDDLEENEDEVSTLDDDEDSVVSLDEIDEDDTDLDDSDALDIDDDMGDLDDLEDSDLDEDIEEDEDENKA